MMINYTPRARANRREKSAGVTISAKGNTTWAFVVRGRQRINIENTIVRIFIGIIVHLELPFVTETP